MNAIEQSSPGKVYLVGAGPGDLDLITVKGLTVLRQADVIIYDYLVNPTFLQEAKPQAQKIYAGKMAGNHTVRQDEINQLLVEHARQGKVVVRLKGGDPFVFGRGGEEADVLVAHGIVWEIVPGVTSAIAVLAYAGIPVTHRDCAGVVTIIAGYKGKGSSEEVTSVDWQTIARVNGTLVILMGIAKLPFIVQQLVQYGRVTSTPVAVIRWGTMPEQQTVTGTLGTIEEQVRQARLQSPAIIVVGDVVNLSQRLQWFRPAHA